MCLLSALAHVYPPVNTSFGKSALCDVTKGTSITTITDTLALLGMITNTQVLVVLWFQLVSPLLQMHKVLSSSSLSRKLKAKAFSGGSKPRNVFSGDVFYFLLLTISCTRLPNWRLKRE